MAGRSVELSFLRIRIRTLDIKFIVMSEDIRSAAVLYIPYVLVILYVLAFLLLPCVLVLARVVAHVLS